MMDDAGYVVAFTSEAMTAFWAVDLETGYRVIVSR